MRCFRAWAKVFYENNRAEQGRTVLKLDEFEQLRRQFVSAVQLYEKSNAELFNTKDQKQRGILIYHISSSKQTMEHNLRQMVHINARIHKKLAQKRGKLQEEEEKEIQYKNITLYHLQNVFFKVTKYEHSSVKKKQFYPEPETLGDLKLKAPLREMSEEDEPDLEEQELLAAIKQIDDDIQLKMDFILEGIKMLHQNALCISESIGVVHQKILVNIDTLQQNIHKLKKAQQMVQEASNHTSRPSCVFYVVVVMILALIIYLIIRKVIPETADSEDILPQ